MDSTSHLKTENKKDKSEKDKRASGSDHSLVKPNWLSSGKKSRHRHSNSSDRLNSSSSIDSSDRLLTLRIRDENEGEKKEVETVHFNDTNNNTTTKPTPLNVDLSNVLEDHPDVTFSQERDSFSPIESPHNSRRPNSNDRHKHKSTRSPSRGVSPEHENDNSREKEGKKIITTISTTGTTSSYDDLNLLKSWNVEPLVYLNIGGYKYTVDRRTLCSEHNYFTALLSGKYPVIRDRDNYIYINRPGIYFGPILEFLITNEVVVPPNMCERALAREAVFYGVDFPLVETHRSLLFVTDSWLEERFEQRAYFKIAPVADIILGIVLQQFKEKADKSVKIEVSFLMKDNARVNEWLDQTENGKLYQRFEFIDQQKKLYNEGKGTIANDEYFSLLENVENQKTIIAYASLHDLSLDIVPIKIHEPGVVGRHYFTIGYKIVHLKKNERPHNYRHSSDSFHYNSISPKF